MVLEAENLMVQGDKMSCKCPKTLALSGRKEPSEPRAQMRNA